MIRLLMTAAVACAAGVLVAAPVPKQDAPTFIDLQPKANQKLADDVGGRIPDNNLAAVPTGEQTFAKVKFKVGEKMVQLGSPLLIQAKPEKVEGIAVGRPAGKLHFLHSTLFGHTDPAIEDGELIAEYRIHYADGKTETVPVKYGVDVRDWWYVKDAPSGAEKDKVVVAWEGENEATKPRGRGIRLYLTTWTNPRAGVKVTAIDFARAGSTQAAPFCVAITAE